MIEHQSTSATSDSGLSPQAPQRQLLAAVAALLVETGFWLLPAGLFLLISGLFYDRGWSAVAPHLWVVFRLALALLAIRLILAGRFNRLYIGLCSLAFAALIGFYVLTLIGYMFWGRTPTLSILIPYVRHFGDLFSTLHVTRLEAIIATFVFVLGAIAVCSLLISKTRRWVASLTASTSRLLRQLAGAAMLGLCGFAIADVSTASFAWQGEPFTLMFNADAIAVRSANSQRIRTRENRLALADRERYVASDARPTRNVIVFIGDALRHDRMSLFGANRQTTPELDKLAATDALAYQGTITTSCAESFCGLITISRSRYTHDVSRHDLSLSEVLAMHGYKRRMILGGDHTNFYGLREWFGEVEHYWDGTYSDRYANDDRAVLEELQTLPQWNGTPEYLQLHLMSTHAMGTRARDNLKWTPTYNYYRASVYQAGSAEHTEQSLNHYDNGLLQFDAYFRQTLDILKARGYLEDALVIVTGDHGEMLGEQQLYSHSNGVYQPAIEVPLLMFRFGHSGQRYQTQAAAAQIDIAPSVLAELALPAPGRWQGSRLDDVEQREFVFFEHANEFGLIDFSVPTVRWKYWVDRKSGQEYAFELHADPGETNNQAATIATEIKASWRQKLKPSLASEPLR